MAAMIERSDEMYPNFRILVVDDSAMMRSMMRHSLHGIGFENLDEASDGREGFELIEKAFAEGRPYVIVFADWNMPRMNGLELLEACRESVQFSTLPFVMISAEREPENINRALRAGALDFIVKPFSAQMLYEKLSGILLEPASDREPVARPDPQEAITVIDQDRTQIVRK